VSDRTSPSLHEGIDAVTGSGDQRLLYGLGVPFLTITALIIAFALYPKWYFLVLLVVAILAAAGVVVWGLMRMLDEDENEDEPRPAP
jgi:hypothetical protein